MSIADLQRIHVFFSKKLTRLLGGNLPLAPNRYLRYGNSYGSCFILHCRCSWLLLCLTQDTLAPSPHQHSELKMGKDNIKINQCAIGVDRVKKSLSQVNSSQRFSSWHWVELKYKIIESSFELLSFQKLSFFRVFFLLKFHKKMHKNFH